MPLDPILLQGLSAGGVTPVTGPGGLPPGWKSYGPGGTGRRATGVTNVPTAAGQATAFDISQSKELGGISDLINQINRNAQQMALQQRIPGGPALEAQSSQLIGQELGGKVPADVMRLLQQQAAERGVATGVGADSPNATAAYLQALGLTSIGQQQTGEQNLTQALARNPAAPLFNPDELLLTPGQTAQLNLGYLSEADRAAAEQQQLALEAARIGQSRANPYGYGGFSSGDDTGYQYAEPGTYAYGAPAGAGLTGGDVLGGYQEPTTASWLASLGQYAAPADTGLGGAGVALAPGGIDYSGAG